MHGLWNDSRRADNTLVDQGRPKPWRWSAIVALCDKKGPFVAPGRPSGGIYEFEEAFWVCSEVTTE